MPPELLDGASQHYDLHRKRLMLSALLRPESRTFALAYQLALVEFRPLLEKMVEAAAPPDAPTRRLLHMSLANYAAGAIMMPYAPFLEAAERHRYDIDRLCALFGASVEQVAHRLTTLGRSGARGIPFFMLRVDAAGNISKRFAGEAFPFSRFGGTCPRWNLHTRLPDAGPGGDPDRRDARTASASSRSAAPSSARSGSIRARTASSPSASAATSNMRRASSIPTASTSPSPMSRRSAPPAPSAPASAARSAPRRRPGGRSPSTSRKTISPYPFLWG